MWAAVYLNFKMSSYYFSVFGADIIFSLNVGVYNSAYISDKFNFSL